MWDFLRFISAAISNNTLTSWYHYHMTCPICLQNLELIARDCLVCPQGHGVALSGSQLMQQEKSLVETVDKLDKKVPTASYRQYDIPCPNCGATMKRVDYCSSGIIIDTCAAAGCHFRWLDGDEFGKIKNRNSRLSATDILALAKLEAQTNALKNRQQIDHNPELPRSYLMLRIYNNPVARSAQLGIALSTLIKGMIYSPFLRVVGFGFVVIMAVLGYIIFKQLDVIF